MVANNTGDSVAVIGAGIAGLSCAQQLTQAGMNVTVFEKSRGPGGRMSTRRAEPADTHSDHTWQCDHGAQYFTARDPLFIAQVQRWQQSGVVAQWQGTIKTIGQRPDVSGNSAAGIPATDKPLPVTERYVGTPRMTAPAHQLASGLRIMSGARIVKMSASAKGWHLQQENDTNTSGPFRHLVLAIPAQQAGELLAGLLADQLTSQAPHTHAVEHALFLSRQLALRPCWALMLNIADICTSTGNKTPGQPINSQAEFDAAFVNPDSDRPHIVSWISRDSSKPGRPQSPGETWLVHATPAWSEQYLESDPNQVQDILLAEFRRLTGITADVSASSLHRWRFAQTGELHTQKHLSPGSLWIPDMNGAADGASLGLCGDWLNGGRVEGAWLSGYHLARQMVSG